MPQKPPFPELEDHSLWESMRDEYLKLLRWCRPDPAKPAWLEYLKWIYKIPILALATLISPIAFLILAIVFFATL